KTFVGDSNGRVDLGIDATSFTNGGNGFGTTTTGTGFQNVSTGTHSVNEIGRASCREIVNYDKAVSCDNGKGSNSGQTSTTTSTLAYGGIRTLIVTGVQPSELPIVKTFVGDSNGRVDLGIDATSFTNGGNGFGTTTTGTGFQNVSTGTHSVN